MLLSLFASEAAKTAIWPDIGMLILGVIGLIGVIGAVSAYFYKGRADALIKLQKEEINVLQDTNKRLTDQNAQLIRERAELIAEHKRMKSDIKNLQNLLSQPKQLEKLAKTISEQHLEVVNKLTDIAAGLVDAAGDNSGTAKVPKTSRRS